MSESTMHEHVCDNLHRIEIRCLNEMKRTVLHKVLSDRRDERPGKKDDKTDDYQIFRHRRHIPHHILKLAHLYQIIYL